MSDDDRDTLGLIELDQNLADIDKPPELSAGNYTAEIQDVQIGTSQKGNRYYAVKFVIPPEEIPADLAEHFEDGAVLYWNRVIVPDGRDRRALFNLRKFIEALGLNSATTTVDPNEWMGCKARLRVVSGSWQGEPRAEIKAVESAEGPKRERTAPAKESKAAPAKGRGRR